MFRFLCICSKLAKTCASTTCFWQISTRQPRQLQLHQIQQQQQGCQQLHQLTAATSVDITAAADVRLGTTTGVKAVATTAAALRERSKVWAGERRSSARASVFEQRRNSLVNASQESPDKLSGAEDLNESFRIQFEEEEMQREELICSSCLSTHHDVNNPLCIFCGWKVLEQNKFVLKYGKDSRVNPVSHNF